MYYYRIEYLQQGEDEIYRHLPVVSEVTTERAKAEQWFQNIVDYLKRTSFRKLVKVSEKDLDYMCYIKRALFECVEPGYAGGAYLVELACYTRNPNSD